MEETQKQNTNDKSSDPKKSDAQFVPSTVHEEHSHLGPILGVLVILLVLILGGLYLWGSTLVNEQSADTMPRQIENNEPETTRANADADNYGTVSSSDELSAIEADLESTNFAEMDAELQTIEQELQ